MESEWNWILQPISSRVHIQKKWISNPAGEVTSNSYSLCPCLGNKGLSSYHPANLPGHASSLLKSHSLWLPSGRSLNRFPDLYSLCLLGGSPTSPLPTTDIVVSSASSLSPLPMTEVWWQIQQILDPSSLEDLGRVSDVACSWIFSNSVETRSTCPALLEGEAVHRAVFRTSGQFTGSLQSWDFSSKLPCVYVALCDLMGPLLTALY